MLATPSFLSSLRSRFPSSISNDRTSWYLVSAVTFSICNYPEEVANLFRFILDDESEDAGLAAKKISEGLLKAGLTGGLPKAINALTELGKIVPPEMRQTTPYRLLDISEAERQTRGEEYFKKTYGKISERVLDNLHSAYPDLAYTAVKHIYSPVLSYTDVISAKETSYVLISSLIPQDVNPQLKGHLRGGLNQGATREEIDAVRSIAMSICEVCGVKWRGEVANLPPATEGETAK
ncbi:hypothetical protein YB2330_005534 [Saitoella coloradoensis]